MWITANLMSLPALFLEEILLLAVWQDASNKCEVYICFKKNEYAESYASMGGV